MGIAVHFSFKGLLVGYAVCAIAVLVGMLIGRAKASRLKNFHFDALVAYLLLLLLWSVLAAPLLRILVPASWMPYLAFPLAAFFSGWWGKLLAQFVPEEKSHKRGALISKITRYSLAKHRETTCLTLAGFPVAEADETKHFKMIGTTGTGKSTAIRELLAGALKRGDRAVIADPDGSYSNCFFDAARGDLILNPFDARASRWDLFGEMTTLYDADQLARSLIADGEGTERSWREYARVFLTSLLRQLHRAKRNDLSELYTLISTTHVDDLRDLLADTAAGPYLVQDNGRFFSSMRAVANTHLRVLEPLAYQSSSSNLSVREWVRRGRGTAGVLFLTYQANQIATLRNIIGTWMRLAIFEAMSQPQGDQRLWFAIDELDALGQIDGLKDALARLRKFGGRCVLGFQSIAQVAGSFGHAEAQTIVENCGNTLMLRCSASENGGTARFASQLIGEREILRDQTTKSRRPTEVLSTHSVSQQHVTESAVLTSEIEQLADFEGYLKFASKREWQRVTLKLH
jgi:type IV secretory pathway TraG/TraD family ATPase VirD4